MRVGSLFAGMGGFDYAAALMGGRTIWYSEIEPWACTVMAHHFPDAPNGEGRVTYLTLEEVIR